MGCLLCHILMKFCCDPLVLWITSQFWWWFVDCLFLSFSIFSRHYGPNNPIIKSLWGEKADIFCCHGPASGHRDQWPWMRKYSCYSNDNMKHDEGLRHHFFDSASLLATCFCRQKFRRGKTIEGVECEGFKEHKKIKTSLRKRIDQPVGEARYADRNILKRR